jgi:hypothetical protein
VPHTTVNSVRADLERRIAEIRPLIEELPRLERALAALGADEGTSAAARGPAPSRSRSGRQRRPRGANREAILAVIESRPGVSVGEVANVVAKQGVAKNTACGDPWRRQQGPQDAQASARSSCPCAFENEGSAYTTARPCAALEGQIAPDNKP